MIRRFRNSVLIGAAVLTAATTAGCFGRFPLVSAVYDFNRGIGDKLVRTLVMWVMLIIPVYVIASLGDIFIFNVVEFWGGGSAVAKTETLPDGRRVELTRVSAEVLRVRVVSPGTPGAPGAAEEVEIVKVSDRAGYVRRPGGPILATVEQTASGEIVSRALQAVPPPPPSALPVLAGR